MTEISIEELPDAVDPARACARLLDLPYCLLLESAAPSNRIGRFSFIAADPFLVLRGKHGIVEYVRAGGTERVATDPFAALETLLARYATEPVPGLPPFQGGAAGYFAYDLAHRLERLPSPRHDDLALPDLCIGLYDWTLAWDHARRRAWLVSTGLPAGAERAARAAARARQVRARLARPASPIPRPAAAPPPHAPPGPATFPVPGTPGVSSTFSREAYLEAVARTREYILAGDVFQANLSQRLEAPFAHHPFELYRRLRRRNPAPFAGYFDLGAAAVVSASPERFLRLDGDVAESRPIKGTRPRGADPPGDVALERALLASEKDRAENIMIVDLVRNDLSKVCEDRSVHVPELCLAERYATVHHLVSTVTGRLRPGLGALDLLRAAFPGGSVTGAPKVRAMEIIAELEPVRRGVYTGALGYIAFHGAMDTSIAIRTFVVKDGVAFFPVGAGIVADSDPGREYLETLDKARGLVAALESCDGPSHR